MVKLLDIFSESKAFVDENPDCAFCLAELLQELKNLITAPADNAVSGVRSIVDAIEQYRLLGFITQIDR